MPACLHWPRSTPAERSILAAGCSHCATWNSPPPTAAPPLPAGHPVALEHPPPTSLHRLRRALLTARHPRLQPARAAVPAPSKPRQTALPTHRSSAGLLPGRGPGGRALGSTQAPNLAPPAGRLPSASWPSRGRGGAHGRGSLHDSRSLTRRSLLPHFEGNTPRGKVNAAKR
jgi:hypothetical protein